MMQRTHLSIDVCDETLYWVRSKRSAQGVKLVAWGSLSGWAESLEEKSLGQRVGPHFSRTESARVALDAPAVVLQRENLPVMTTVDAARIAERRAGNMLASGDEQARFAWLHRGGGRASPLWLCAAPMARANEAHELWSRRGVDVKLLASRQLALGNLVQLLPETEETEEPELTAFLDLDVGRATCVLSDREGWVFGREFPLHDLSEIDAPEPDEEGHALDGRLEAASSPGFEPAPAPAVEMLDVSAMRLATELRRTFRYVDGELALGRVTRICASGSSSRIAELCVLLSDRLDLPATLLSQAIPEGPVHGLPDAAAVALGLALWPSDTGGNLLPPPVIAERERNGARSSLLFALGSVLAVLALGAAGLTLQGSNLRARVEAAEARLEATHADHALMTEQAQTRLRAGEIEQAVARIDHPLPSFSGLLTLLSRATPAAVHVERLRAARSLEGWTLLLEVEASEESVVEAARAVSDLAHALKGAPLLKLDRVVQDDGARMITGPDVRPRVRFRFDGRLAPLAVSLDEGARSHSSEAGDEHG